MNETFRLPMSSLPLAAACTNRLILFTHTRYNTFQTRTRDTYIAAKSSLCVHWVTHGNDSRTMSTALSTRTRAIRLYRCVCGSDRRSHDVDVRSPLRPVRGVVFRSIAFDSIRRSVDRDRSVTVVETPPCVDETRAWDGSGRAKRRLVCFASYGVVLCARASFERLTVRCVSRFAFA